MSLLIDIIECISFHRRYLRGTSPTVRTTRKSDRGGHTTHVWDRWTSTPFLEDLHVWVNFSCVPYSSSYDWSSVLLQIHSSFHFVQLLATIIITTHRITLYWTIIERSRTTSPCSWSHWCSTWPTIRSHITIFTVLWTVHVHRSIIRRTILRYRRNIMDGTWTRYRRRWVILSWARKSSSPIPMQVRQPWYSIVWAMHICYWYLIFLSVCEWIMIFFSCRLFILSE